MKLKIKAVILGLVLGFAIAAITHKGLERQRSHKSKCQMMLSSGYCVK